MNQPADVDTATTADQIAKKLHAAIDRLNVHANSAEERIQQATQNMEQLLKQSKQTAADKADEVSGSVKQYVDQHPLASLGMAFGAGVLLAVLLRRH